MDIVKRLQIARGIPAIVFGYLEDDRVDIFRSLQTRKMRADDLVKAAKLGWRRLLLKNKKLTLANADKVVLEAIRAKDAALVRFLLGWGAKIDMNAALVHTAAVGSANVYHALTQHNQVSYVSADYLMLAAFDNKNTEMVVALGKKKTGLNVVTAHLEDFPILRAVLRVEGNRCIIITRGSIIDNIDHPPRVTFQTSSTRQLAGWNGNILFDRTCTCHR